MKPSNQHILEYLIINKDYCDASISPKSYNELRKIIEDRYKKFGPGTKQNPIDFNDIDVSNIDSFYNRNIDKGIFSHTDFKYIDISDWDVSNVTDMSYMFFACEELKSVGDLSNWDVSNVKSMNSMFFYCAELKSTGDISKWDVSNVNDMGNMFECCESFNQDLSSWNISNVTDMDFMFYGCKSFNQDISKWDVSNVTYAINMFEKCQIKEEYKPKFK